MKFYKIFVIIIIGGGIFPQNINSQNISENLNKYWYYRHRLKTEFMLTEGDGSIQGTYLPAGRRNAPRKDGTKTQIKFADTGIYMGYYLGTLATEYRLLKNSGQDYSETLLELSYALRAIDRLDRAAEGFDYGPGTNNLDASINGFFIRDDVNNEALDNSEFTIGLSGAPEIDEISAEHLNKEKPRNNEMSIDQVWGYLMGFALVKHLVDDPTEFCTLDNLQLTVKEWAQTHAWHMVSEIRRVGGSHNEWELTNPMRNEAFVHRGCWTNYDCGECDDPRLACNPMKRDYGFAEAGNWITDYPNSEHPEFTDLHTSGSRSHKNEFYNLMKIAYAYKDDTKIEWKLLMTIFGGDNDIGILNKDYGYEWLVDEAFAPTKHHGHLRLIYTVLHGSRLTYDNPEDRDYYMELLNTAPECGPYKFVKKEPYPVIPDHWYFSTQAGVYYGDQHGAILDCYDIYDGLLYIGYECVEKYTFSYPHSNWSCVNRLHDPEWLDIGDKRHGYYSGLDYMLLHNLFWLCYRTGNVSHNYPYCIQDGPITCIMIGYQDNPEIITHKNISSAHKVYVRQLEPYPIIGNLILQAENNVTLLPGFKAESGTNFRAIVSGGDNIMYKKTDYIPNCIGYADNMNQSVPPQTRKAKKETTYINEDLHSESGIQIAPNPTNGSFTITFNYPVQLPATIEICNITGKCIYKTVIDNTASLTVNLSGQTSGLYLVRIKAGGKVYSKKIVKQN